MDVQYRMRNWYGHMVRREEQCVGRMTMEMSVKGRWKRGRPKRRPNYIISSNIDSQKSGTKMKRILTDEDDVP